MQYGIPGKCVIILAILLSALELGASVNDCGDSTFTDQSSGGSPVIADCQQIATNIQNGGSWTISLEVQRTLATYGTCAFGATLTEGLWANIGNEDIEDLIASSIQMFSWNGLVGAEGKMNCGPGGNVDWAIYHT